MINLNFWSKVNLDGPILKPELGPCWLPLYAPFSSYEDAVKACREGQVGELKAYVQRHWPHSFIYEHGNEWSVLPFDWRMRKRIEEDDPELYKTLPYRLSATRRVPYGTIQKPYPNNPKYSYWEHTPEDRAYLEGEMWRLAASTWTEYMRTAELKAKE